jgi:tetratricopeptide (TPR) repeat protein
MKWLLYVLLAGLVAGSWVMFSNKGKELETMRGEVTALYEKGDPDGLLPAKENKVDVMEGERTFSGVLLTFLSAGLLGILFVFQVLPAFAQRITHSVYDSAEMVEKDVMRDARSLLAQGDYQGAIDAFKQAAAADPLNRLPWVEIAKIYKENLDDPASAILTIRHALENQAWEVNDAAYFLFRLAELYDEVEGDRASAVAIMRQVVEQFPGTRHSANASHKLHEWSTEGETPGASANEPQFPTGGFAGEEEYLEKLKGSTPGPTRYELPPVDDSGPGRTA